MAMVGRRLRNRKTKEGAVNDKISELEAAQRAHSGKGKPAGGTPIVLPSNEASLAGLPAMSLPCGFEADLPLGMQLIGPHFGEQNLLRTAETYQRATSWHTQHPEGFL